MPRDDLAPLSDLWAQWRQFAACANEGEEEWWLPEDDAEDSDALIALGKSVCSGCSVRIECLDDDMAHGHAGVRGGLDDTQKLKLKRHRDRYLQYFTSDVAPALEYVKDLSRSVRIKLISP